MKIKKSAEVLTKIVGAQSEKPSIITKKFEKYHPYDKRRRYGKGYDIYQAYTNGINGVLTSELDVAKYLSHINFFKNSKKYSDKIKLDKALKNPVPPIRYLLSVNKNKFK